MNISLSLRDKICLGIDQVVRALADNPKTTGRPYPAIAKENLLSEAERQASASLMRVNHAGEICAQALYHGQKIVSRSPDLQQQIQQAALEEGDHLAWCKKRLDELNSHTSYLNPCWYAGSFCIGLFAGMMGDGWSLGFVVETERQVIQHLAGHLQVLASQDERSHQILKQMEQEEGIHRDAALSSGACELPAFIKKLMTWTSKIMVKTAYYV